MSFLGLIFKVRLLGGFNTDVSPGVELVLGGTLGGTCLSLGGVFLSSPFFFTFLILSTGDGDPGLALGEVIVPGEVLGEVRLWRGF